MSAVNAVPLLAAAGGDYQISRSVRLRSSASAYLNRTPSSAGNRKTWTWSAWVKRGSMGVLRTLFGINIVQNDSQAQAIFFGSDDKLYVTPWTNSNFVSNAVFRDPSAWYHIVVAFDSTNATANNRVIVYVNGVNQAGTYPLAVTLNADYGINQAGSTRIGDWPASGFSTFDGYLTEINFIDGQALTPSSFGENDAVTGVWKPKKYAGTYGTNGFYLNFSDNSAATAAAIGKDYSGNGNNWTPNNISVTAGVTYDSMLDSPTPYADGGNGRGNYAVLNPVFKNNSQPTFSNANLSIAGNTVQFQNAFSTIGVISGKWYVEATVVGTANSANMIGISNAAQLDYLTTNGNLIGAATGVGYGFYVYNGQKYTNGTGAAYSSALASGDVLGMAFDADGGTLTFYKNGVSLGTAFTGITASTQYFFGGTAYSGGLTSIDFNFGQRPFSYTPPTGFKALNTLNLPDSLVVKGNTVMDATLYTGNNSTQSVVNAGAFKPDLVWIKGRSQASNNALQDSVRGVNKYLLSNSTGAEGTDGSVTSFNSNGFSLTTDAGVSFNANGTTYVAWQWKAGGTASSNTSGSITSTVSVNASAGFSVVTYTGTGANATVGHGLGVAPKMLIVKQRGAVSAWDVYHASLGATGRLYLNTTDATNTSSAPWNNTAPTSSVFTVGTATDTNNSGGTLVAYCWSEVAGYSKFGSYTGNGSTDGPFVYCGFRPRWVMVKCSSNADYWLVLDTARDTYNTMILGLKPNASDAEASVATYNNIDITANGFKIRGTDTTTNGSARTFIYAAFAENPFKNSLAR